MLAPIHGTTLSDELTLYLNTEPENVKDAIRWWYEKHKTYPQLHQMALDYLTIPGMHYITSVFPLDVYLPHSNICGR